MNVQPSEEHMNSAIRALRDGGIVIFPTDTAFGIGCRIDDEAAVDRLYKIRQRPPTQASPVLVGSFQQALAYFDTPSDIVRRFMKKYWPGALTIIAPCHKSSIYSPIRGNGDTVGLRQPDHATPLGLIEAVGVPILGPSANFHGMKTPFAYEHLDPELCKLVDFVMPGVTRAGMASTVVDCSVVPYQIVRQGSVELI